MWRLFSPRKNLKENDGTRIATITTTSSSPTAIATATINTATTIINDNNKKTETKIFEKRKKYHQHLVEKDQETIEEIAIQYYVKVSDIIKWNPSFQENQIFQRGQAIQIKNRKRDVIKKYLRQFFQKKKQQTHVKKNSKKKRDGKESGTSLEDAENDGFKIPRSISEQLPEEDEEEYEKEQDNTRVFYRGRSISERYVSPARRRTRQRSMMEHIFMPHLIGTASSHILAKPALATGDFIQKLETHLPPHFQGYDWKLLYNLSHDGSCLDILVHKVDKQKGSIILIETTSGHVFGGFIPVPWKKEASYYGKGEAFVFNCQPEFQRFGWKRTNTMFMMSNNQGIGMGGGGGGFAWYMDADLIEGTSAESATYLNPCLTGKEEHFKVRCVEVWGFVVKF